VSQAGHHDRGLTAPGYAEVRAFTEALAAPLSPEDQTVQSMPDVSPTKWHRAHTSWFFETFVLAPNVPGHRVFDEAYGYLFNSYYEAVGPRHARVERGLLSRPGASEIGAYRLHVDEAMGELLDGALPPAVADLVELGLHHEQQHQELLLMDIKHVLSVNPMRPAYCLVDHKPYEASALGWIDHDGGLVEIGARDEGLDRSFAFDNERPRHRVWLEPFSLADRLVTCGEWLAFIDDGGYRRPELWLSDGWATVATQGWDAPLYWFDGGPDGSARRGEWSVFGLAGARRVDEYAPVRHVSYYEADAYARWAGARLPTEAEWETVAGADARETPCSQLFGETWQWTASDYAPYPGFAPAPGAVGEYNGKFMVGQHVLRGSSRLTPPGHGRLTYRNFFPPAARWAMSGVRLAR
jgi:ergothioneine biosynthesis protein EgtB